MILRDIIQLIEEEAPLALQESYDNAGLSVGDYKMDVSGILLCIDVTEAVIEEAIENNLNLIISHHPLIFKGLKRITGKNEIERCVSKAIKNDIAIYSAHTNLDNVLNGVNGKIADKLHLTNRKILVPKTDELVKLVTFVPSEQAEKVREALFNAGAGNIGNYDECSFNSEGKGTFRAGKEANPYVGEIGERHSEPETRIEVILPKFKLNKVIEELRNNHPYEEPAYDIFPLLNSWDTIGTGIVGELETEQDEMEFLQTIKKEFQLQTLKYTPLTGRKIKRVAVCGGAGSQFLTDAIRKKADIYISGDFKYHEYFLAENKILIADIGHYESEQFTKDVFYEIIIKKIPKFAVRISKVNTNPIKYL